MIKKILVGILLIIVVVLIWQHELVLYGISQAKGQLNIIANAKPIEYYLDNEEFPDSLSEKLLLVQEVREFAIEKLGMNPTDNYTTVYNQEGAPVLWVVTASKPYQLEAKEWKFPLLGSFSYKGFFIYDKAVEEEKHLKALGYDTSIRTVSGWSTLGFFKDPILSNMLYRDAGSLANLIIHELTHTTLYIKDSVTFNENLASLIGHEGAKLFLSEKFGTNSKEYVEYVKEQEDREKFSQYVLSGADQLDVLYKSLDEEMTTEQKEKKKHEFMDQFIVGLDTIEFNYPDHYKEYFENYVPNNTFFLSYLRYRGDLDELDKIFKEKFNQDVSALLKYYKDKYPSL